MLYISDMFLDTLPLEYFYSPYDLKIMTDHKCVKPDEDDLIAMDPSKCADSVNILSALNDIFPKVKVILTGGGVYYLGLSDVIHNIILAGDNKALDRAMIFDDLCLKQRLTQYVVAYGKK